MPFCYLVHFFPHFQNTIHTHAHMERNEKKKEKETARRSHACECDEITTHQPTSQTATERAHVNGEYSLNGIIQWNTHAQNQAPQTMFLTSGDEAYDFINRNIVSMRNGTNWLNIGGEGAILPLPVSTTLLFFYYYIIFMCCLSALMQYANGERTSRTEIHRSAQAHDSTDKSTR